MTSTPAVSSPSPSPAAPRPVPEVGKLERVRRQLRELVVTMQAGEQLAPERDLAAELGVARMTLRRAVDTLVDEQLLVRRQGAGTFVAPNRTVAQRLSASSFTHDMRSRGLRPGGRTLLAEQRSAGMVLASLLDVEPSTPVLHVRRLRTADDEPMAVEDLHVPCDLVPGLTGADLEGASFYALLAERYGTPVARGTQTVEPVAVTPDDATVLGVVAGSPAFCFERTSRLDSGRVAEYVRSIYRGDRYRIVVDIFPPRD